MGISGLLPFLKNSCRPTNLREFSGLTVAVDVYCWLHKGAFGCAEQLVQGRPTDGYVKYVMKYVSILLSYKIKPILVFDGRNLPSKSETEKKRRESRKENKAKAIQLLKEGKPREARDYMQRCVDITPAMAREVIQAARERNVDCIVAPYEADAQLSFLNLSGLAQAVLTEDSDLTLFGCEKVIFKLMETGDGILYERSELGKVFGLRAENFSFEKFRYMCIMAGCDYHPSLQGIGLGKSKKFWMQVTNLDLNNVLRKIPSYLKMPTLVVTPDYIKGFIRANTTFLHQLVFDPITRKEIPLTPYSRETKCASDNGDLSFCGSFSPPNIALQLALGNLDLHSLTQVGCYDPDSPLNVVPKYGTKDTSASVWMKNDHSQISIQNFVVKENKCAFQFTEKPLVKEPPILNDSIPKLSDERKRKSPSKNSIIITEENIADLLTKEDSPPPAKKSRLDPFRKFVGDSGANVTGEKSKYFKSDTENDSVKDIKGRNSTTPSESGTWFENLSKPTELKGKFIYRVPEGEKPSVLSDISNSPEKMIPVSLETPERVKKRNPFAKRPSQPINMASPTSLDNSDSGLSPESKHSSHIRSPVLEKSREKSPGTNPTPSETSEYPVTESSPTPTASSSQLSLYSTDECSQATTVSLESQASVGSNSETITTLTESPKPIAPRLGLSKFAKSSSISQEIRKSWSGGSLVASSGKVTKLGPARVSGLSKSKGSSMGSIAKNQPSLLSMFARQEKKANL